MKASSDKHPCPHCNKLYSKGYLKKHIASAHDTVKASPMEIDDSDELMMTADEYLAMMNPAISPMKPIEEIKPKKRQQPEEKVQRKLEKSLGGKHQVTDVGIIDILTDTELIEIKAWPGWKTALGQLFAYGHYYPTHMKRIHLFGEPPSAKTQQAIFAVCASLRIRVTIEPYKSQK